MPETSLIYFKNRCLMHSLPVPVPSPTIMEMLVVEREVARKEVPLLQLKWLVVLYTLLFAKRVEISCCSVDTL